jgi:hypothetical protein
MIRQLGLKERFRFVWLFDHSNKRVVVLKQENTSVQGAASHRNLAAPKHTVALYLPTKPVDFDVNH